MDYSIISDILSYLTNYFCELTGLLVSSIQDTLHLHSAKLITVLEKFDILFLLGCHTEYNICIIISFLH